jgi:exodeoxyribonuclease VII large subunit
MIIAVMPIVSTNNNQQNVFLAKPDSSNEQQQVFTVSQFSQIFKKEVESIYGNIAIRGEISGLTIPPSGHAYMTLKDNNATISAVCWRGNLTNLAIKPEDGLEVIARGRVTTFPARSTYQLQINSLQASGQGAWFALLEKRKRELANLFDVKYKKQIPVFPRRIAVITSPKGAVIQDIIHRLNDRYPCEVLLWPSLVQGKEAVPQLVRAIVGINNLPQASKPDVIILARGGGSIEDLWCFNEEEVARAIFASQLPIISAVGHESDVTIADYVADKRAPTPTAAAEIATPVQEQIITAIDDFGLRMYHGINRYLDNSSNLLALQKLPSLNDYYNTLEQRLDYVSFANDASIKNYLLAIVRNIPKISPYLLTNIINIKQQKLLNAHFSPRLIDSFLQNLLARLDYTGKSIANLSPLAVMERGYTIVKKQDQVVSSASKVAVDEVVSISWYDGDRVAVIKNRT